MFELLVLLAEPEVAVGGHDAVVLGEVLQLDGPRGLDHGVRQADGVDGRAAAGDVVRRGLVAAAALELAEDDECEEDDDEEHDRHGDPHQDRRVVGVRADRLRPARLAELVPAGVGADLCKLFALLQTRDAVSGCRKTIAQAAAAHAEAARSHNSAPGKWLFGQRGISRHAKLRIVWVASSIFTLNL